ncbi:gliding motility-associated C-terminal domain-containing protein [Dyadobacter sp. LJ53]|uniref:T9SS type B sorting domain-containing protein n=1 Tax=Dyadobacter chenwenxiniae TaxID=2906456 RepID=UPI001F210CD3|nr:gliding motility-associated C-terminal domain-containing protein [Dyadobacter chenwenxiniae]MCF0051363.1 gliding motility-associated C-terminal domain-containing protein [Dyadobacter chenwenxiniae]
MGRFYNKYQQIFYSFILILLATVCANAQDFVVEGQCMQNPDCEADSTTFRDTLSTAIAWQWSFGEGAATDTRRIAQHSYMAPGSYTVTLVRTLRGGTQQTVNKVVQIGELPPAFQQWKTDTTICPGDTLILDPYPNGAPDGAKYVWYPKGDTTQTLNVDSSGCYSVEVILPNGCKIQDRINVKICMEPANQEGAKWYFGGNAGLDFSNNPPTPITDGKLNTPEGTSSIANSKGQLLFYSDGITVWNKNGDVMPCFQPGNCAPLKGSPNSTQSVLIVPQPTCKGCEYLFNVFTTSDINGEKLLTVSVVDMRRNNGLGAIIETNTTLQQPTTERIVSARNDRDSTYWVISHDYGTNKFRIFHATTGGLVESSAPELGMKHDSLGKAEGYMKFSSPDSATGQRRLAVIIPGPPKNYVELFSFNDSTGTLTYDKTVDLGAAPPTAYGIEFSPSGEKMYISFSGENGTSSYLKQYDLTLPDSLLTETAITIDSSANRKFGALQFGPDGRIYMAIEGSDYLAVIGEPEGNSLTGVEYERDGVSLGGKKSELGLPNMVQDFTQESSGPGFEASGFCTNEPTTFEASPICDPIEDTYQWDFLGDGSFTAPSKEQKATYTYTQPGDYIVRMRASNKCKDTIIVDTIRIYETPPPFSLGADKDTCGAFVPLDMGVQAEVYAWIHRGRVVGRQKTYNATATGRYIAVAFNGPQGECFSADTIEITLRRPPAFSIGPDTTLCRDSSIVLTVQSDRWIEFDWSTGEETRDITVGQPGSYFVIVKDRNDCYNSDTIQVGERPSPILNLLPEYAICIPDGQSVILDANGQGVQSYEWPHSGDTTRTVTVGAEGTYTVIAINKEGCVAQQSTEVVDRCEPRFFIPDAFTPDGEGHNEQLDIFGAYYTNFSIRIYNRWGEVIYASTNIEDRWNGTYKGQKVQPGAYPYVISYEALYYPERAPTVKRGSVMIIR